MRPEGGEPVNYRQREHVNFLGRQRGDQPAYTRVIVCATVFSKFLIERVAQGGLKRTVALKEWALLYLSLLGRSLV